MQLNILDELQTKHLLLESRLRVVEHERIEVSQATGRILARPILNFRDSPALDISAMDGYAFRYSELANRLPRTNSDQAQAGGDCFEVTGVAAAGARRLVLGPDTAIRIFTGGVVPQGADVVIPRERCREESDRVWVTISLDQIPHGWNIRRQGENAKQDEVGLQAGCCIDGPRMSSIVSMNREAQIDVSRKVRVTIINTGDELMGMDSPIEPWQIRDSNGPLLESMLRACPWIEWNRVSARDDLSQIQTRLNEALDVSDAVLLTGGVSMGDTDHVPAAVRSCGAEVIFHRLAIRPGAPVLGAVGSEGQLIMGLPGNPVSVAVTFRRLGLELLDRMARRVSGRRKWKLQVAGSDSKTLGLVWYRLVQIQADGTALLLANQGSGDIRSLGLSDGFIEVPPGSLSQGMFAFYDWNTV
ncbi:MAG: molybdopterin molybdotransferase MoeA [Pirellula sp.]|nr:molybdopterin molybdotransferase MoeA [Pirellula sp.]